MAHPTVWDANPQSHHAAVAPRYDAKLSAIRQEICECDFESGPIREGLLCARHTFEFLVDLTNDVDVESGRPFSER